MENRPAENDKQTVEVDLLKLCRFYLHRWWILALCCILAAGAAFIYTRQCVVPQYRSTVSVYVNNSRESATVEYVSGNNLATAQRLVSTYINIIRSDSVLSKVIEAGNLDCTPGEIRRIMTAEQVDETEMFTVSVQHPDPQMAALIVNTVAQVAPAQISAIVEGSSARVIDFGQAAKFPYTPNTGRNMILGGLAGLLIALVVLTIVCLSDNRIRSEEDLRQSFGIPVLGTIPNFDSLSDNTGYVQRAASPSDRKKEGA